MSEALDVQGDVRHSGGQGADKGRGSEKERPSGTASKAELMTSSGLQELLDIRAFHKHTKLAMLLY